jgi:hypothetical protein
VETTQKIHYQNRIALLNPQKRDIVTERRGNQFVGENRWEILKETVSTRNRKLFILKILMMTTLLLTDEIYTIHTSLAGRTQLLGDEPCGKPREMEHFGSSAKRGEQLKVWLTIFKLNHFN